MPLGLLLHRSTKLRQRRIGLLFNAAIGNSTHVGVQQAGDARFRTHFVDLVITQFRLNLAGCPLAFG